MELPRKIFKVENSSNVIYQKKWTLFHGNDAKMLSHKLALVDPKCQCSTANLV
jgi:hypothetical protein